MSLERAKIHLDAWYQAEIAVSTGQSYTIGNRTLTRANIKDIKQQINYWENRVKAMSGKKRRRSARIIPRDF